MKYSEQYIQLKNLFDLDKEEINIPGSLTKIRNFNFQSRPLSGSGFSGICEDSRIPENNHFRYPVIVPEGIDRNGNVIIYLHGLNERTWYKHLTGARYLAEKTGHAVLMFPLSFHINRGRPEWSDARKMNGLLDIRKRNYPGIREASIVNLALSDRLTRNPQRFFLSGLQSAVDLISLLEQIQKGDHPAFMPGTKTDFFAYSISCMLMQSLMVSKVSDLLSRSRIVFFAGGSLFSHMQGISKFIMDSVAFNAVSKYYRDVAANVPESSGDEEFQTVMMENHFGMAFRTILSPDLLTKEREKQMADFHNNLMVIALRDDRIIPVEGIRLATGERFSRSRQFKVLHFPYSYSHENPFPVMVNKIEEQVEQAFRLVYDIASHFINGGKSLVTLPVTDSQRWPLGGSDE